MEITAGLADIDGIDIAYEQMGDPDGPAVLLVMGLGCQLLAWPVEFCRHFVDAGYRVVRFDNRDIGLSTMLDGHRVGTPPIRRLIRHQLGLPSDVPYTLVDMSDDTIGLLDHLGIDRAHVVGASMGGMITQVLTARFPERVASMSILFSSTNQPLLPIPKLAALRSLITGPGPDATRDEIVAHTAAMFDTISGPAYPGSKLKRLAAAGEAYDRSHNPRGIARQLAAVTGTGSLRRYAQRITAPTVVVHGTDDPLVHPAGGRAIARAVPGARLIRIDGMGHDIPEELYPLITSAFMDNFTRTDLVPR